MVSVCNGYLTIILVIKHVSRECLIPYSVVSTVLSKDLVTFFSLHHLKMKYWPLLFSLFRNSCSHLNVWQVNAEGILQPTFSNLRQSCSSVQYYYFNFSLMIMLVPFVSFRELAHVCSLKETSCITCTIYLFSNIVFTTLHESVELKFFFKFKLMAIQL